MIKTFRGLLKDGQQERIRLEHRDGKQGYRIKKLELISFRFGHAAYEVESTVKIFSIAQTSVSSDVNFSEQSLLAANQIGVSGDPAVYGAAKVIVFDSVTFNQDIYITHKNQHSDLASVNYYLELETVSLDDVEATAVILKNFRNTNTVV